MRRALPVPPMLAKRREAFQYAHRRSARSRVHRPSLAQSVGPAARGWVWHAV